LYNCIIDEYVFISLLNVSIVDKFSYIQSLSTILHDSPS